MLYHQYYQWHHYQHHHVVMIIIITIFIIIFSVNIVNITSSFNIGSRALWGLPAYRALLGIEHKCLSFHQSTVSSPSFVMYSHQLLSRCWFIKILLSEVCGLWCFFASSTTSDVLSCPKTKTKGAILMGFYVVLAWITFTFLRKLIWWIFKRVQSWQVTAVSRPDSTSNSKLNHKKLLLL